MTHEQVAALTAAILAHAASTDPMGDWEVIYPRVLAAIKSGGSSLRGST